MQNSKRYRRRESIGTRRKWNLRRPLLFSHQLQSLLPSKQPKHLRSISVSCGPSTASPERVSVRNGIATRPSLEADFMATSKLNCHSHSWCCFSAFADGYQKSPVLTGGRREQLQKLFDVDVQNTFSAHFYCQQKSPPLILRAIQCPIDCCLPKLVQNNHLDITFRKCQPALFAVLYWDNCHNRMLIKGFHVTLLSNMGQLIGCLMKCLEPSKIHGMASEKTWRLVLDAIK